MIFLLFLLVILIYVATIAQLLIGFDKIPVFRPKFDVPKTFFSIVVPFRNEVENLPKLLESIKNLNYPKELFEIIMVDDFSEDNSVKLVYNWRMENGEFQFTLLENIKISGSPKKDAISRAIPIVKKDWIITTDADCNVPENWLSTLDNYISQNEVSMVAGPVLYEEDRSFLRNFQHLDLTSLQGATIGSFGMGLGFMCNGANFSYKKSFFNELGGFSGNNNLASGDDVFLLQKAIARQPKNVHYLKSESFIVKTDAENSWKKLFFQRVRWASKTGYYYSLFGKDLAIIVFFGNLGCILGLGFSLFGINNLSALAILLVLKAGVDVILLHKTNRFLTNRPMKSLILSTLFYPFFCVFIALYSMVGSYKWKGRRLQ